MRFGSKGLLLATLIVALGVGFVRCAYMDFTRLEMGENVPSVGWLPDGATNVSYYRSYLNTAYEFDIDEQGFLDWSRWDVTEIDRPVRILRYVYFSKPPPTLSNQLTDAEWEEFAKTEVKRSVEISDGLYYVYRQSNGGGVMVGYDRTTGRAYYQSAPR